MAKDPAILFYTSDFRQGTMLMTDAEVGQYIKLLCDQHQNGHLPKQHMFNICHTEVSLVWDKFEIDENGLYFNKRMDEEIKKRKSYCESRRLIRQNYLDSKLKTEHMSQHTSQHTLQRMENENGNRNINRNIDNLKKSKRKKFVIPTIDEVIKYFTENGYSEDSAKKAFNHYALANWFDTYGKPVLNWKQKMHTNWFKDDNRTKETLSERIQKLHA